MPKEMDKCIRKIEVKIKKGKIPTTFKDKTTGEIKKSSPYAICRSGVKKYQNKNKRSQKDNYFFFLSFQATNPIAIK